MCFVILVYWLLCVFLQGYQGMVDGGDHIVPAEWKTVSNIIQRVCMFLFVLFYVMIQVLFCLINFGYTV